MKRVLVLKEQKKLFNVNQTLGGGKVLIDNTANLQRESERIVRERAAREAAEQERLARIQPGQTDLNGKVIKAPVWNKEPRDKHLLDYLRTTGGEPDETDLRETRDGVRQARPKMPSKVHRDDDREYGLRRLNIPNMTGSPFSENQYTNNNKKNTNFSHFYESADKKVRAGIKHLGDNRYGVDHYGVSADSRGQGVGQGGFDEMRRELEAMHGGAVELTGIGEANPDAEGFWDKMNQNSIIQNMVIVKSPGVNKMVFVKHAESAAAKKHKSEYDTKYETTPERKKYRAELLQARRVRHVDGKGGKDMSHTVRGTIVPEDMHTNRARHFKERGTLKKTIPVMKSQPCPTPSKKSYTTQDEAEQDASLMGGGLGVYGCPCGNYHFTSNQ